MKKRLLVALISILAIFSVVGITTSAISIYDTRAKVRVHRLKGLEPTGEQAGYSLPPSPKIVSQDYSKLSQQEKDARLERLVMGGSDLEMQQARALIEAGGNINARSLPERQNILIRFIDENNKSTHHPKKPLDPGIIDRLVDLGLDIDTQDSHKRTALYYALWNSEEMSKAVAAKSAPLDAGKGGEYLHEILSFRCEPYQIRCLLELGADPNARDEYGRTTLARALSSREISELLLASGADVNAKDDEGLNALLSFMTGIARRDEPVAAGVAELLVGFGLAPNERDDEGRTLLMRVCQDTNVMDGLLKRGAEIDAVTPVRHSDDGERGGESLLWLLSGREPFIYELGYEEKCRSVLKFLVEKGANVDLPDVRGYTPLMRAVQAPYGFEGTPSVLDLLLSEGANVDVVDSGGMTPLLHAASAHIPVRQKEYALGKLLKAGANPQVRTAKGETPLSLLVQAGEASAASLQAEDAADSERSAAACVRLLVAAGVDPNARDASGKTLLIEVAGAGTPLAVVRALLDAGADPSFSGDDFKALYNQLEERRKEAVYDADGLLLLLQSIPTASLGETETSLLAWVQQGGFRTFYRFSETGANTKSEKMNAPSMGVKSEIRESKTKPLPRFFLAELLKRDWPLEEKKEALAMAKHHRNAEAQQLLNPLILTQQEKDDRLFRTVELGRGLNMRQIEALVEAGADINATNGDEGLNILMHHLRRNDRVIFQRNPGDVNRLIELGLDIDAQDKYGRTALYHALGNEEMFDAIAAKSAPFGAGTNDRILFTALHTNYKCKLGQIRRLLELGANINIRDNAGRTPLAYSLYDREIFGLLLEHGADVGVKDDEGRNVLAMYLKDREQWRLPVADGVTERLLDLGMDPNERDEKGRTLLMHAHRDANVIGVLLDHGADIDAVTPAWHFADGSRRGVVMQLLVSRGGNVVSERQGGLDPSSGGVRTDGSIPNRSLDMSLHIGRAGGESLILQLSGPDSGTGIPERGENPLRRASLALLLTRGANVNLPDVRNHTPLMRAVENSYGFEDTPSVLDFLLGAGADVNAVDDAGMTPLLYAAGAYASAGQKARAFRRLLEADADPLVCTAKGETPLLLFARTTDAREVCEEERAVAECVKLLLAAGVGANDPDESGNTPLLLSASAGAPLPVIRELINAGANASLPGGPAALCGVLGQWKERNATFDLDGLLLLLNAMPSVSSGETGPSLLVWAQQDDFNALHRSTDGKTQVTYFSLLPVFFSGGIAETRLVLEGEG